MTDDDLAVKEEKEETRCLIKSIQIQQNHHKIWWNPEVYETNIIEVLFIIKHLGVFRSTPHNPKVVGSNPTPATKFPQYSQRFLSVADFDG